MGFDDAVCNRHAKPSSFGFGCKERLEDPPLLLGVQSGAVIKNGNHQFAAALVCLIPTSNLDRFPGGRSVDGVFKDVAKNLCDRESIRRATRVASQLFIELRRALGPRLNDMAPDFHPDVAKIAVCAAEV